MSNWLIGREIVEEEQRGKKRAGYGKPLLKGLSEKLQADFGKGYSVDNLELFRCFYRIFRPDFRGGAPEIKRGIHLHRINHTFVAGEWGEPIC